MGEFRILMKLIRLTKATLTDTRCRILIENTLSDPSALTQDFHSCVQSVIGKSSKSFEDKQLTVSADDLLGI